jgi:FkbM family methyltransferase
MRGYIKRQAVRSIGILCKAGHLDLRPLINARMGILQSQNQSGEVFFASKVLPRIINSGTQSTIFDIGANEGDYAAIVLEFMPDARIFCFEPNSPTYDRLCARFQERDNISLHRIALGEGRQEVILYDYADSIGSGHASLYEEVFVAQHHETNIRPAVVRMDSLDEFCAESRINHIDLLKIDVEGHEYKVLQGASNLLKSAKIRCIQFEFNEMNVISRTFLKDYYDLLTYFDFFRLRRDGLLYLGAYGAHNEIFQLQNIVAIQKKDAPIISDLVINSLW